MALFNSNDIYTPVDHTETILLEIFEVPEDEPTPTLTILFNSDIRKLESRAAHQHSGFKMKFLIDGVGKDDASQRGEAVMIDEPQAYCTKILKAAYKDSTGIFEKPTKELMLGAIEEKPVFARALASQIMGFFASKDITLKKEEAEQKNA